MLKTKVEDMKTCEQIDKYFQKSAVSTKNINSVVLQSSQIFNLNEHPVADQWERLGVGGKQQSMSSSKQIDQKRIDTTEVSELAGNKENSNCWHI